MRSSVTPPVGTKAWKKPQPPVKYLWMQQLCAQRMRQHSDCLPHVMSTHMDDAPYGCADLFCISSPSEQFSQVHEKSSHFPFQKWKWFYEMTFIELNDLGIEKAGWDVSLVKTVKLCYIQLPKRSGKHACGYNSTLVWWVDCKKRKITRTR